jgi:hypothetical protein
VPRSECTPAARTHMRATKKVFVGGLPSACGDREFFDYFARFGDIAESQVMYDHQTSNSRGFGFVTFAAEATVDRVVNMDHDICGKFIEVKRAEPKQVLEARRNGAQTTTAGSSASTPALAPPFSPLAPLQNATSPASALFVPLPSTSSVALSLSALSLTSAATGGSPVAVAASTAPIFPAFSPSPPSAWPSQSEPLTSTRPASLTLSSSDHPQQRQQQEQQSLKHHQHLDLRASPLLLPPQQEGASPAMSGMGFFAPASTYPPELTQLAHTGFYGAAFPHDAASFGTFHPVQSARADRRFHPFSARPLRDRVDRSYR